MSPYPSPSLDSRNIAGSDIASEIGPLLVVSPHYDDAVFSCGRLLDAVPGSTVITVCTAHPEDGSLLTDWDSRCGFSSADEAMRARAIENRNALAMLRARGVDLAFLDSQYLQAPRNSVDLLGDTLLATISEFQPASVFAPVGLFHADHVLVSDVLMSLEQRLAGIHWFAYADIPYCKQAERVQQRLAQLAQRGVHCEPFPLEMEAGHKAAAVEAYRSQFRGLGHEDGAAIMQHAEQYWRIHHDLELL